MQGLSKAVAAYVKPRWKTAAIRHAKHLADPFAISRAYFDELIATKDQRYTKFSVPKADGKSREICNPDESLTKFQRAMVDRLYGALRIPQFLHGGLPRRSVQTFAQLHVGSVMVATLDVKDFFPSIDSQRVYDIAYGLGLAERTCKQFAEITTLDGRLPQGAATSTFLANYAFLSVDLKLRRLCKNHELCYTRFVDDIAISGMHDFEKLSGPLQQCISAHGFTVASHKVRFLRQHERQEIVGLVVNDKLRPTKEYWRRLSADIDLCRTAGIQLYAALEGISVSKAKGQLNGRIRHLARFDPKKAKSFSNRMNDVAWHLN